MKKDSQISIAPKYLSPRGFTLIEMLVVLVIVSLMAGMGVGGYLAFSKGATAMGVTSKINSMLRSLRNTAITTRAPSGLVIERITRLELRNPLETFEGTLLDQTEKKIRFCVRGDSTEKTISRSRVIAITNTNRIRGFSYKTVGNWQFEAPSPQEGFLGRNIQLINAQTVMGKFGNSVLFDRDKRNKGKGELVALTAINEINDPFAFNTGGRIVLWAYMLPNNGEVTLFNRKRSYELKVDYKGRLRGGVGGDLVTTNHFVMPTNHWVKIEMMFDYHSTNIIVDDVWRVGSQGDIPKYLSMPKSAELSFGKDFPGLMDNIIVQRRTEVSGFDLPDSYKVSGANVVLFDSRGNLSRMQHKDDVLLKISNDSGYETSMKISTSGRITN